MRDNSSVYTTIFSLSDGHSEVPHAPLTAENEVGLGLGSEIPQGLPGLRGIVNLHKHCMPHLHTGCQLMTLT